MSKLSGRDIIRLVAYSVILSLLLLVTILVGNVVKGADDTIYLDSAQYRKDLPECVGSDFLQFTIGNMAGVEKEYKIDLWNDYANRAGGELPLDSSWFVFRETSIVLPPNGKDVFHIDFNIPSPVPGSKYTGWFKVYDVPQTQFKVITVVIRTGSAIPQFDFMIKGSSVFTVPVWGPRETQTTDEISFRIANKGSADSRYIVFPRAPDTYTKGGVVYQYVPEVREWIDFKSEDFENYPSYSLIEHPEVTKAKKDGFRPDEDLQALQVSVGAYQEQTVVIPLKVPADAQNGLYTIFLQIMDIGPENWTDQAGMGLNESYAIKIFFELDREGKPISSNWWDNLSPLLLLPVGILAVGVAAFLVIPSLKGEKKSSKPSIYGRR